MSALLSVDVFYFDVTRKCISYVSEVITPMPGNPGQEVLVGDLISTVSGLIYVTVTVYTYELGVEVSASANGELRWRSNHPEAIELIIKTAEQNTELVIKQAEKLGPFELAKAIETGNWLIVGVDIFDSDFVPRIAFV